AVRSARATLGPPGEPLAELTLAVEVDGGEHVRIRARAAHRLPVIRSRGAAAPVRLEFAACCLEGDAVPAGWCGGVRGGGGRRARGSPWLHGGPVSVGACASWNAPGGGSKLRGSRDEAQRVPGRRTDVGRLGRRRRCGAAPTRGRAGPCPRREPDAPRGHRRRR